LWGLPSTKKRNPKRNPIKKKKHSTMRHLAKAALLVFLKATKTSISQKNLTNKIMHSQTSF
jgi:hypothetical protein